MAKKKSKRIGFHPKEAPEGGGMPTGLQMVEEVSFVGDFDYGGTRDEVTAMRIELKSEDDNVTEQFYTVGNDFEPNKDGKGLTAEGELSEPRKNVPMN